MLHEFDLSVPHFPSPPQRILLSLAALTQGTVEAPVQHTPSAKISTSSSLTAVVR